MKLDFLSDLHIDFHVSKNDPKKIAKYADLIARILPENPSNTLFLGGDYSHLVKDSLLFLTMLSKYYKQVFIVFGNHDYYDKEDYPDSISKVEWLRKELNKLPNVRVLNNEVVTYCGKRIFGADMLSTPLLTKDVYFYSESMNDSVYISGGLETTQKINKDSIDAYNLISSVDVVLAHSFPIHFPELGFEPNTNFYVTVGELKAPIWFAGHIHANFEKERAGTKFIANALGYTTNKNRIQTYDI